MYKFYYQKDTLVIGQHHFVCEFAENTKDTDMDIRLDFILSWLFSLDKYKLTVQLVSLKSYHTVGRIQVYVNSIENMFSNSTQKEIIKNANSNRLKAILNNKSVFSTLSKGYIQTFGI